MAKRLKLQVGDLFTIQTPKGKAYLQYVFTDNSEIECIRVLEGIFRDKPESLSEIIQVKELYCVGFPLKAAYNRKIVEYVGKFPVPTHFTKPKYMRTIHTIGDDFLGWFIVNMETSQLRLVKELSDDEKKMSPAGVWNDTLLIERIVKGWTPKKDADYWAKQLKK